MTHGVFVFIVRFVYQKWLIHLILDDINIFDPRIWLIFIKNPYYKDYQPMGQVSFYRLKSTPLEKIFKCLLIERYLTHTRARIWFRLYYIDSMRLIGYGITVMLVKSWQYDVELPVLTSWIMEPLKPLMEPWFTFQKDKFEK